MRIAHVITYVSDDGAFGGPVAVLRAQTAALAAAGHDVEVFAGWDGRARLRIPGVRVHLFRARRAVPRSGFHGLVSGELVRALRERLPHLDVVHVHLGRHLLDLLAARTVLRGGGRLVLQPHGMVMPSRKPDSVLADAVQIRRLLAGAVAVLALTEEEEEGLRRVSRGRAVVRRIVNGIAERSDLPARDRPSGREALFLARLHPRKRVLAFAEAAQLRHETDADATFAVVGPDEGDLASLQRFIEQHALQDVLHYEGAVPVGAGADRIAAADVYVLPSRGEVFPMTVLEALAVGTPVVLSEDCAIAADLAADGAAVVVDGSARSIADAVGRLLDDAGAWRAAARAGRGAVAGRLSTAAVTATLLSVYVLSAPDGAPRGEAR